MSEEKIIKAIEICKNSKKSFSEFIYEIYKDKLIEVYLGDEYEQVNLEQISTSYPSVLCGKVIGAYGGCLIINTVYVDQNAKTQSFGNILFINEMHIKMLSEVDNKGSIQDSFFKAKNTHNIKKMIKS